MNVCPVQGEGEEEEETISRGVCAIAQTPKKELKFVFILTHLYFSEIECPGAVAINWTFSTYLCWPIEQKNQSKERKKERKKNNPQRCSGLFGKS